MYSSCVLPLSMTLVEKRPVMSITVGVLDFSSMPMTMSKNKTPNLILF